MALQELLERIADDVTGHEEEPARGVGSRFGNAFVKLSAAETWHFPIANEHFVLATRDVVERGLAVVGEVDLKAILLENLANQFENPFFVIDHQDAFTFALEADGG